MILSAVDNFRPVQSTIGRKVSLVDTSPRGSGAGWADHDDHDGDVADHDDHNYHDAQDDDHADDHDHDYHDNDGDDNDDENKEDKLVNFRSASATLFTSLMIMAALLNIGSSAI